MTAVDPALTPETPDPTSESSLELREAVGVFSNPDDCQAAIEALQEHGFDRTALSTVAGRRAVERMLGHFYQDVREIEDDARVPRASFVSKRSLGDAEGVIIGVGVYVLAIAAAGLFAASGASTGWVIVAVVIAGAIGGGLGWLLARQLDRSYARHYEDQLRRGGIVLWVGLRGPEQEETALRILGEHRASHVHVHAIPIRRFAFAAGDVPALNPRPHPTAWWNP